MLSAEPVDLDNFQALAIGPGIGQEEETALATFDQLKECFIPLVLDADALNVFSTHRNYLNRIPKRTILTPHIGELERIIGRCNNSFERLTKAKELSAYLQCYIVLKGAYTVVITPEGNCYFNQTGNPGMATGGSGDVLTGIILALLSQGYSQENACRIAVYVHGLAGDIARNRVGEISLTAGDIIEALPEAWLKDIARSAALGEDRKSHKSQNNIDHDRQRPVHRTQQQPRQHRKQKLKCKRNYRNRNFDKCPYRDQCHKHCTQHKVFRFHMFQNYFLLNFLVAQEI